MFGNGPFSMAFILSVSVSDFAHVGSKALNDTERVAAEAFERGNRGSPNNRELFGSKDSGKRFQRNSRRGLR